MRQGLVNLLGNVARFLFSLGRLVRVPLCDIISEEVHHVLDVARYFSASNKASLSERLRLLEQILGMCVESGSSSLPQDVMQMHHATCRAPFEDGYIRAGTIERHDHSLQNELEAHRAIPCHEERVLVHKRSLFAFAEILVVLNLLHHCNDAYNVVPVVPLRR